MELANIDQKLWDPDRVIKSVLGSTAVPGLRRVEAGDPVTCSRSAVKRWSTGAPG